MAKKTIKEQAQEVLAIAEKKGLMNNFFFRTTFKRYEVQMEVMERLEEKIEEFGELVVKEYVKGRENICINPAITEYNKTSTAANQTVNTLINIIKAFTSEDEKEETIADVMSKLVK